jgi:hypothetical protein
MGDSFFPIMTLKTKAFRAEGKSLTEKPLSEGLTESLIKMNHPTTYALHLVGQVQLLFRLWRISQDQLKTGVPSVEPIPCRQPNRNF